MTPAAAPPMLLEVDDLAVRFRLPRQHLLEPQREVRAVDGVSLRVRSGQTFGIVGESGCGKTTTAQSIMGLVSPTAGAIRIAGVDPARLDRRAQREHRRRCQMVFQDPYSSLNPRLRVTELVREPLDLMDVGPRAGRDARVAEVLQAVGLRPDQHHLFVHQFSGGQRQRIAIARALAPAPQLVVLDEPVSALDVAIQAQILNLLASLQQRLQLGYLFISHDLHVVACLCDEIAVMYAGRVVEQAAASTLFDAPAHPYTRALLAAVPGAGASRGSAAAPAPGSSRPATGGCAYAARCARVDDRCRREVPLLRVLQPGHQVACHHPVERSTVERPEAIPG